MTDASLPTGAGGRRFERSVRNRWRRADASPQPSLDAVAALREKADRLRLVDAMPGDGVSERQRTYVRRALKILLFVVIVGQRFVIPFGASPVQVTLFAGLIGVLLIRARGGVRYNRVRTELYIAAGAAIVLATWFSGLVGNDISINSLFLLLILYVPWVFCVSRPFLDQMQSVLQFYVKLMLVAGVVGVFQMLGQLSGAWQYTDYIQDLVGPDFVAQGYNTANQISYFDTTIKANAFVFLEPSFLSQFLALALIISLLLRAPAWQPLLLGIGMAATLSGTGILLLALGVVVMLIRVPNRIRPRYVVAGVIGLAIVFASPAADILLARSNETSQSGSSGSLRFVQPYQEVGKGLADDSSRYLIGAGAGSSERLLVSDRGGQQGDEAVTYVIAAKLAFEYGLIAAVIFVAFLLVSILRGPPLPVLPSVMILMLFFLSASLLQPHTVLTAWLLTSIWGNPVTVGVSDALAAARRLAASGGRDAPSAVNGALNDAIGSARGSAAR